MYKLQKWLNGNTVSVLNTESNKSIPFDPANTDFQEYQKWIALGNQPLPADEPALP